MRPYFVERDSLFGGKFALLLPASKSAANNADTPLAQVRQNTFHKIHPAFIEGEFFSPQGNVLTQAFYSERGKIDPSKGQLAFNNQVGAYAHDGIMISIIHPTMLTGTTPDEIVESKVIGHYSRELQVLLVGGIVSSILGTEEAAIKVGRTTREKIEKGLYKTVYFCNDIAVVNIDIRSPKTMPFGHGQVGGFDLEKDFIKTDKVIPHLEDEREITLGRRSQRRFPLQFVKSIFSSMKDKTNIQPLIHLAPPYGYGFRFTNITRDNVLQHILEIQAVLEEHFAAYEFFSKDAERKIRPLASDGKFIPTPSWVFYAWFNKDGNFQIVFCPKHVSHAGALETADVYLERDPKHEDKKIYTNEQQLAMRSLITQNASEHLRASKLPIEIVPNPRIIVPNPLEELQYSLPYRRAFTA